MARKKYVRKTLTWEGKRYEVRAETEREAVEQLAVLKAQLKKGEKGIGENMTVNAWFDEWLELYKKPAGLTAKSLGMYTEKYDNYIKPKIGTMKLKDVKEVHLQRILNEETGKSFSHVSKIRLVLKAWILSLRQLVATRWMVKPSAGCGPVLNGIWISIWVLNSIATK